MKNQHTQPSFARCVLHVRAIFKNPSRISFYVRGIAREFSSPLDQFILAGFALVILCEIINLFF